MIWAIVAGVAAVASLGVAAWKLPSIRIGLATAASFIAAMVGLAIAMIMVRGDVEKAKRRVKVIRKIKTAAKDHKRASAEEAKKVSDIQDELDGLETDEHSKMTLDLEALADRVNDR